MSGDFGLPGPGEDGFPTESLQGLTDSDLGTSASASSVSALMTAHTRIMLAALTALGTPRELIQLHGEAAPDSLSQSGRGLLANLQQQVASLEAAKAGHAQELEELRELKAREAHWTQEYGNLQQDFQALKQRDALREQEHQELWGRHISLESKEERLSKKLQEIVTCQVQNCEVFEEVQDTLEGLEDRVEALENEEEESEERASGGTSPIPQAPDNLPPLTIGEPCPACGSGMWCEDRFGHNPGCSKTPPCVRCGSTMQYANGARLHLIDPCPSEQGNLRGLDQGSRAQSPRQ